MWSLTCKDSSGVIIISESKALNDPKLCIVSSVVVERVWLDRRVEKIREEGHEYSAFARKDKNVSDLRVRYIKGQKKIISPAEYSILY